MGEVVEHKPRFLEQSWLHGIPVPGSVQGSAWGGTSCIPARALGKDALLCLNSMLGPRGPGETEESVGGCRGRGEAAAQQLWEGLQVPARELGKCAGCWLWGRARVLGARGGSVRWVEELGHEQRCWVLGLGAGW